MGLLFPNIPMSEQQETPHEADEGTDSRELSDRARESEGESGGEKAAPAASSRTGHGAAWLAIVVAFAAAGFSGWQWWITHAEDDTENENITSRLEAQASEIESHSRSIDEALDRIGALGAELEELSTRVDSFDFNPSALQRQVRSQSEAIAQLREDSNSRSQQLDQALERMASQLEQSGAAGSARIEESLADARSRLGLMEVAGLLRLGQARAELASDASGAVVAYERALARLESLEDGRLDRLRQLIAREAEALRSVERPDWAALSGRLSALEAEAARWPVSGTGRVENAEAEEVEADSQQGWWASLRDSLDGLVRVTPRETAPLAPAAVESVRERLRLHLAAAQAAVAGRRIGEMRDQIAAAESLIRNHFDTSSEPVSRALETMAEALSADEASLPDLGAALAEVERRLGAS